MKNNKKNNSSLILRNNTALTRVANQIDTTNKILTKINTVENRKWWEGLDDVWKRIFLMNLRLSESDSKFEYLYHLKDWYTDIFKEEFKLVNNLKQEEINDILNLEDLTCFGCQLDNVNPVSKLTRLKILTIGENDISDLTPLSELKYLESLDCQWNPIIDFSPLNKLPNLKSIEAINSVFDLKDILLLSKRLEHVFVENRIFNFELIEHFSDLTSICFSWSGINNLNPLRDIKKLEELWCMCNLISSIEPLSNLSNLSHIWFSDNLVDDLSPIESLSGLEKIDCSSNLIKSIKPLFGLKKLKELKCQKNFIPIEEIAEFRQLHPNCEIEAQNQYNLNEIRNKSKSILMIYDEDSLTYTIKERLHRNGFQINTMQKDNLNFIKLNENKYDLFFLILKIPTTRLVNFLFNKIKVDQSVPRIILTPETDFSAIVNYLTSGAHEYIRFPYDWSDIENVLKKYLIIL